MSGHARGHRRAERADTHRGRGHDSHIKRLGCTTARRVRVLHLVVRCDVSVGTLLRKPLFLAVSLLEVLLSADFRGNAADVARELLLTSTVD